MIYQNVARDGAGAVAEIGKMGVAYHTIIFLDPPMRLKIALSLFGRAPCSENLNEFFNFVHKEIQCSATKFSR
jgi:hypothetical protein